MPDATQNLSPMLAWRATLQAADMTPSTIKLYTGAVRACANHAGADPADLTPDQITMWLRREGLSRNTRNAYYRTLVRWQTWLAATGRTDRNMLAGMQPPRKQATRPKPISTPQLQAVLALPLTPKARAMILLAAYAGLRRHEVAAFKGTDLDRWDDKIRVLGKGKKHAELPAARIILGHAEHMPLTGWWFPSPDNPEQHITPWAVYETITRNTARAGDPATPHQLRHWYGTQLVRAGVPLTTVRTLMRHESLATTQVYIEVTSAEEAAAVAKLPGAA